MEKVQPVVLNSNWIRSCQFLHPAPPKNPSSILLEVIHNLNELPGVNKP